MTSASALRLQIETDLAQRIPSALSPTPRIIRPVAVTGIANLDAMLKGGLPVGALTELVGPECSGRTSVALSFLAQMTAAGKVCAWMDVTDALDPVSAAAAGVDLARLLWVRCGVVRHPAERASNRFRLPEQYLVPPSTKKGLHGGGMGSHPRTEVHGLSEAVSGLFRSEAIAPRCAEPQKRTRLRQEEWKPNPLARPNAAPAPQGKAPGPWLRIEQSLRATDLLLQAGGFSAIVLDMGSLAPEFVLRVPLATWFRYRAAAERTQSSILLLTQHPCAKSSAELLLRLHPAATLKDERTVFTGIQPHVEMVRRRFAQEEGNVVTLKKPPQSTSYASWQSRAAWVGRQ